jgi:hypothetical protein
MDRHRASDRCLNMIFAENRIALFRIMLWRAADGCALRSTSLRPLSRHWPLQIAPLSEPNFAASCVS